MKVYYSSLPETILQTLFSAPEKEITIRRAKFHAVMADMLNRRRLDEYDILVYHHNPLHILKELYTIDTFNKNVLIVPNPDYSDNVLFPYNLLEERIVRNFYEDLIFETTSELDEGLLTWFSRLLSTVKKRLDERAIHIEISSGMNVISATRNFEIDHRQYSFVDFKSRDTDGGTVKSPNSLEVKNKLLKCFTDNFSSLDLKNRRNGDDLYFKTKITGSEFIQKDEIFDNLSEWMDSCNKKLAATKTA